MSDQDFMHRIAKPSRDPRTIPEDVLWTLTKNGRTAQAHLRIVPIGAGRPELRLYVTRLDTRAFELIWSQVLMDGGGLADLTKAKRAEFLAKGWRDVAEDVPPAC